MKSMIYLLFVVLVAGLLSSMVSAKENVLPVALDYSNPGWKLPDFNAELAVPLGIQDPEPNPAPTGWAGAYLFRFTGSLDDRASYGALANLTTLTKRGEEKLSLDAYAGLTFRATAPVAAILLGYRMQPFDQVTFGMHLGAIVQGGHPTALAVGASLNVRF